VLKAFVLQDGNIIWVQAAGNVVLYGNIITIDLTQVAKIGTPRRLCGATPLQAQLTRLHVLWIAHKKRIPAELWHTYSTHFITIFEDWM
jgi:hypothetical protein